MSCIVSTEGLTRGEDELIDSCEPGFHPSNPPHNSPPQRAVNLVDTRRGSTEQTHGTIV